MSDLIDRQAAIDDLMEKDPSQVWDTADIKVCVNALPSVQPDDFLEFLWNVINPNKMQEYLEMYRSREEKTNG